MAQIYLIALIALLGVALLKGLAHPARFYEYPYFMAAVFAVFIVPQAISLMRFPEHARPSAVDAVLLMTLLCAAACMLGYRSSVSRWIVERSIVRVDDRRLFHCGVLFVICGLVFTYLISRMSSAQRGGGAWTGLATIYLFFASLVFPGISICLREALNRRSAMAWLWTIAGSLIPIIAALLYGRRESTVQYALTIALALYYHKRLVAPRWIVATALVIAMLGIPATTQYRIALTTRGLSAVSQIDFIGNFNRFLNQPAILELRNAAMMIDSTAATGRYGLGRAYWDQLVFRFVPAQFVGREFKESLMFHPNDKWMKHEFAEMGYEATGGTTLTGMGDSFREFGYFGALFFAGLAVVFKSLWRASLHRDAVLAQLLYIQTATSAMLAITHQTVNYLPGLVYNLVFLGLAVAYARVRGPQPAAHRLAPSVR